MSKVIEKLKNVGPGALVAAGFVGPGTVTTCTVSGASVGYTMLWALVFATVATIIFQEMAARVGIASQKGLGENIRDRIPNPVLKGLAIAIVIIAIFIGNVAYETGNITGGILGIQAVFDVPMIPIVIVLGILAFACMWVGSYKLVEKILTGIVVLMGIVFFVTALFSPVDWGAVAAGLFTPQLPAGVSNDAIAHSIKLSKEHFNGLVIAGKMHGAGVAEPVMTLEIARKFVDLGVDILLVPAPYTVPCFQEADLRAIVDFVRSHNVGKSIEEKVLVMAANGTSQDSCDSETIKKIGLAAKAAGADLQHIGDSMNGICLPQNIFTLGQALRGYRHQIVMLSRSVIR